MRLRLEPFSSSSAATTVCGGADRFDVGRVEVAASLVVIVILVVLDASGLLLSSRWVIWWW
jgi:hypothetical protein